MLVFVVGGRMFTRFHAKFFPLGLFLEDVGVFLWQKDGQFTDADLSRIHTCSLGK